MIFELLTPISFDLGRNYALLSARWLLLIVEAVTVANKGRACPRPGDTVGMTRDVIHMLVGRKQAPGPLFYYVILGIPSDANGLALRNGNRVHSS